MTKLVVMLVAVTLNGQTPRATVSYSPGLKLGKQAYEWRASSCNQQSTITILNAAEIEQGANSQGIRTIGLGEALAENGAARNWSWPIVLTDVGTAGTSTASGLVAAGVISAHAATGGWLLGGTVGIQVVQKFLLTRLPPDLRQRLGGSNIMADNQNYQLQPRGQDNACFTVVFFSKDPAGDVTKAGIFSKTAKGKVEKASAWKALIF